MLQCQHDTLCSHHLVIVAECDPARLCTALQGSCTYAAVRTAVKSRPARVHVIMRVESQCLSWPIINFFL
jgi:hypothetical protein